MMRTVPVLFSALLLLGCLGGEPPADGITPPLPPEPPPAVSVCHSYSEGPAKVLCYAMELEDMSMCGQISGGPFLEECVIVMAELVYNKSNVQYCPLSKVEDNRKTCEALTLEDIDRCFERGLGEGLRTGLAVRDCMDLVSRKAKDPSLCDTHVTRQTEAYAICGPTQDCENQFTGSGAQYNADSCRDNVIYSMSLPA